MSVEQMISLSYVFFTISVVLAVAAIVLFFVLDINYCIRSIRKNDKRLKTDKYVTGEINVHTEKL
jgi:signal transduction histidine kinase